MKALFPLFFCVFLFLPKSYGQTFNPDNSINSVVQVWVTDVNRTRERKVLTGFVWKSPNQIITAMHGMQAGWKIEVKYANQAVIREARIKKVLPKADLVLLELSNNESNLPANILPINSVFLGKIQFGEPLYCLGLTQGSLGIPSRTLSKGFLQPKETLEYLVPDNVKRELRTTSLGLDLDIIYFDNGNLLPSNSGAPIFDKQGRLVGVGNGGLEKGTVNISWAIPAKYISELENSAITQLPSAVATNKTFFSSSVILEGDGNNMERAFNQSNQFRPVKTREFEFYKTKNRSIVELTETAENPLNILQLNNEIIGQYNVQLDLDNIRLDIYEDIQNGVVVVVPEGLELTVINQRTEEEALQVKFKDNDFTYLAYGVIKGEDFELADLYIEDIIAFLDEDFFSILSQMFGISGFVVADNYTVIDDDFERGRKTVNISATGSELVYSPVDGRQYAISTYVTLLVNEDKVILTAAVSALPYDLLLNVTMNGMNCLGPNKNTIDCRRFIDFYNAFTAAHLTTFAY
jgi:S1-C subfamily serine protease